MCLIAWNWQPESKLPLVLLSNRDEFYARPALPLHWWEDNHVLAGKDLQAGGTWLGVNRKGWLAALTNYRQPVRDALERPSRGALVSGFLQGNRSARAYLESVAMEAATYNPFNLLVYDGQQFLGLESRHARIVALQPGIGAVSNADFHTPWPKVIRLTQGLQQQCASDATSVDDLLPLLHNRDAVDDADLPDTGIPPDREKMLSTAFIRSPEYGTRVCSVLRFQSGSVTFYEQNHSEHGMLSAAQQTFTL